MSRRAEQVDQTRQRITEAAIRLHTTIGPAHTSIASVAEEAGVTRLTVYRHFADLDALFEACRGQWRAQNPPPDASAWPAIPDLEERARHALGELYAWFREHADELYPINRDNESMPISAQEARAAGTRLLGDTLVAGYAGPDADGRSLTAVARHLVDFWTWRSFAVQQDLDDGEIVEIAVRFLSAVVKSEPPKPTAGRSRTRAARSRR